jgi:hypothetical protein
MRSSTCGSSQTRRRGGGGLHRGVRLGHEQEEDDNVDKRAWSGSETKGRKGARRLAALAGPARYAAHGERGATGLVRRPVEEAEWASKGGAIAGLRA